MVLRTVAVLSEDDQVAQVAVAVAGQFRLPVSTQNRSTERGVVIIVNIIVIGVVFFVGWCWYE